VTSLSDIALEFRVYGLQQPPTSGGQKGKNASSLSPCGYYKFNKIHDESQLKTEKQQAALHDSTICFCWLFHWKVGIFP
jgi:hypothetical protein